jgi:YedE family putative selenium metabolism protein
MARLNRFLASRWGIISAGAVVGILAPILQKLGNPGNMGICVACFERDIAGALGLHRAAVVQYLRPEIPGFILGALIAALIFREFRPRSGSAPIVRFFLGVFAMIGALVFLGCPWRALLRLAGGDWTAIVGLLGLAAGIGIGVFFLRQGYSLGRSYKAPAVLGWVMPVFAVLLLLFRIFRVQFSEGGAIFYSESGPGSMFAPVVVSLVVGMVIGILAQRTRLCTMGAIRDVLLMGDTHLFGGIAAIVVFAFLTNLVLGQFSPGFVGQPVAHTNHLWNFGGMMLAGLAFALAGGCPGRQLFLAGEGDGDAGVFVMGMIVGAGFAHNFSLASSPSGPGAYGPAAVIVGLVVCLAIGFGARRRA